MSDTPIQNYYPEDVSYCFGCGHRNKHGHQLKTYWDGGNSTARFTPKEYHTALPGYVYGGLIASLIDCHGTGTASAAMADKRGIDPAAEGAPRFVTASLQVNYRKPTPIDKELKLTGSVKEITDRKVVVDIQLFADNTVCAEGTVITVEMRTPGK